MSKFTLFFCILLGVSGCGKWARHNTTDEQASKDKRLCNTEAINAYPVDLLHYFVGGGSN
jgi:hypothetical protein